MKISKKNNIKVVWQPQKGRQLYAILAKWCQEVLYGGARGGGKTDFLLGDFAQDILRYGAQWNGIIFRKTNAEFMQMIKRSREIYTALGASYHQTAKLWTFPNGATLRFAHLEHENDIEKYQGHSYQWVGIDEIGNFPLIDVYKKIKALMRSAGGVPSRLRATANPGGPGHAWIKEYFIDPAPQGLTPIAIEIDELPEAYKHLIIAKGYKMYIPSKLSDNAILMKNDPSYITRLAQVGSKELVRAWLEGDWNAVLGAYFDNFSMDRHIIEPFNIPAHWTKYKAFDWGYSAPFCCLWGAVSDGQPIKIFGGEICYPAGSIIIYRELYGAERANVGIKWNNETLGQKIIEAEREEKILMSVADPSIFASQGGISIAEQMIRGGCGFQRADNERIAGWLQIRYRLDGNADGQPLLYISKNCKNLIRTLPIMQHDKHNCEDLDSDLEDHACDTLRYMCMLRPIVQQAPTYFNPEKIDFKGFSIQDIEKSKRH